MPFLSIYIYKLTTKLYAQICNLGTMLYDRGFSTSFIKLIKLGRKKYTRLKIRLLLL